MKPWKGNLFILLVVFTILSLLLSACGPVARLRSHLHNAKDEIKQKITESRNDGDQVLLKNVVYRLRKKIEADQSHPVLLQTWQGDTLFRDKSTQEW